MRPGAFEQIEAAHHIGLDEFAWAMNGAIHMAFCCEMNNGSGLVGGKKVLNEIAIRDVTMHKAVQWVVFQRGQGLQIASVGQLVEIQDGLIRLSQPIQNKIAANETSSARDQNHG